MNSGTVIFSGLLFCKVNCQIQSEGGVGKSVVV